MIYRPAIGQGHGPGDGCEGNGIVEHEYVYNLGWRVYHAAQAVPDWSPVLLREATEDPTQQERDKRARDAGADIVIDLHCDWLANSSKHGATIFHKDTNHPACQVAWEIAYAMPVELWSSRRRARVKRIPDPDYPDASAVVMRYTPPTVLVECGFVSNADDAHYLHSEWTQDRLTAAIMAGLCKGAELYARS